jgi:heme a synthase
VAIVVTGSLVRLSDSGLGCPTWPECVPGSVVPVEGQPQALGKWIEFGNRTLTFVLVILAIAALAVTLCERRMSRPTDAAVPAPIALAAVPLIGTFAQALLGGVTVLTGLHPATVAAHFLLSMVIIAGCVTLVQHVHPDSSASATTQPPKEVRWLSAAVAAVTFAVITLGTIVTGSGPHAGDADVTARFGFDLRTVAWMHADAVHLLVGLTVGLWLALRITRAPDRARTWVGRLFILIAIQGVVGYTQWFAGVPWGLVAVHVLLACLVWVAAVFQLLSVHRPMTHHGGVANPVP